MLSAISRYGARWPRGFDEIVDRCRRTGTMVEGPHLAAFSAEFARRLGGGHAATTSCGRMAAYYIFRALDLPPGSEVVFPSLTFWVVPEMARAAGLVPVFADVDPETFNLCPAALERVLTARTRVVVPTHIYGLPCDMDDLLQLSRRHGLRVVEDCAHALGSTYRGRAVGTFGDAALFSFQVLKPLNTCGGGMAYTGDAALAARIAALSGAEPWPGAGSVGRRIRLARLERTLMRPRVFSATLFPVLWSAAWVRARPDVYLWEKVRPLLPVPPGYRVRYANVQAALGLAGLEQLDEWNAATRRNAAILGQALSGLHGITPPPAPNDRLHGYYQYCVHVPRRDEAVRACLRRGLDVETHHMDVCPQLPLFARERTEDTPGARRATATIQLPVHASLSAPEVRRVGERVQAALAPRPWPSAARSASPAD